MISPTGKGIRNDAAGSGAYGSLRGHGRLHVGKDYLCSPGQIVVAPFDMVVKRIAYPYEGKDYSGIIWKTSDMRGKMFYFEPIIAVIGSKVREGTHIGYAQDIGNKYGPRMKAHIHFQIDKINPQILEDVSKLVKVLAR